MKKILAILTALAFTFSSMSTFAAPASNGDAAHKLAVAENVIEEIQLQYASTNFSKSGPNGMDECEECQDGCLSFPEPQQSQCLAWCYNQFCSN